MRANLGQLVILAILTSPLIGSPAVPASTIAADANYQSALAAIENASNPEELRRRIDDIVAMAEGNPDALIGQLLSYSSKHSGEPQARAVVGRVLKRAAISKDAAVRSLVRHLDDGDPAVRRDVRELLKGYEDRSATRPPDFSTYRAIIEDDVRAGREPRASLVELMFESDAGAALTTMVRAAQLRDPAEIKPILWAEHVVADLLWRRRFGFAEPRAVEPAAVQQLDAMSRHPRWWARLYAIQIVRANPELAPEAMLSRLAGDSNAVVRSAATARKPAPPTPKPTP